MNFITAAAPTWSSLFTSFTDAFSSAWGFIGDHDIFMVLIAIPVGMFVLGSVIKSVR